MVLNESPASFSSKCQDFVARDFLLRKTNLLQIIPFSSDQAFSPHPFCVFRLLTKFFQLSSAQWKTKKKRWLACAPQTDTKCTKTAMAEDELSTTPASHRAPPQPPPHPIRAKEKDLTENTSPQIPLPPLPPPLPPPPPLQLVHILCKSTKMAMKLWK